MIILKKIYSFIRGHSTSKLNGVLSKITFNLTRKPLIKKDNINSQVKFPNGEYGGLIISCDFEMAWAWRYTKTSNNYIKKARIERENFPKIMQVLEKYNIPITFAAVGHLFLEQCTKADHDWMKRIPYFNDHWKFTSGDWFDHDPYSNFDSAPEWYAPDLIRSILNSDVKHEIGSHTFSHIDFSYKNCPKEVASDDIKACIQAAKSFNIKLKSFVFPGGTWGNIEVLKENGFSIYRRKTDIDISYPYRDKFGLLVTTSSAALEYDLNYGWSINYYSYRLKKYIDKAIRTNTIAHFWFHPSLNPIFIDKLFDEFFKYVVNLRSQGKLWIGTMDDIAKHINNNKIV